MSLIADALKKLKKEAKSEKKDRFLVPPTLQNAFNKKKSTKDSQFTEFNPKIILFTALSLGVVAVVIFTFIYFNKQQDNISQKATIENNSPADINNNSLPANNGKKQDSGFSTNSANSENTTGQTAKAEHTSQNNINDNSTQTIKADNNTYKNNDVFPFIIQQKDTPNHNDNLKKLTKNNTTAKQAAKPINTNKKQISAKVEKKNLKKTNKKSNVNKQRTAVVTTTAKNDTKNKSEIPDNKTIDNRSAVNEKIEIFDYDTLIKNAENAQKNKNYAAVAKYYEKAYNIRPDDLLSGRIANAYLDLGDAESALNTVITNGLRNSNMLSRIIIKMIRMGCMTDAAKLVQFTTTLPTDGRLLYTEGYFYEKEKKYDQAAESYRKAFSIDTNEPIYLYSYARALDLNKDYENALKNYTLVLKMNPKKQLKDLVVKRIAILDSYLNGR